MVGDRLTCRRLNVLATLLKLVEEIETPFFNILKGSGRPFRGEFVEFGERRQFSSAVGVGVEEAGGEGKKF